MRFRHVVLALCATMLVAAMAQAQTTTLRVKILKAPIRQGPGSHTRLLAYAMQGDLLEAVDQEGMYFIVRVPSTGQVGYVHNVLVERTNQTTAPPPPRQATPTRQAPPPARQASPPPAQDYEPCAPPPPPSRTREEPSSTQPSTSWDSDDAPWDKRSFGVGLRTGWSTLGTMAGNLRTWGDSAGLSLDVSYLGASVGAGSIGRLQMMPSVLFKIGGPYDFEAVYIQPYAGGGGNLIWSRVSDDFFDADDFNGIAVGWSATGGIDLGFHAVPSLTVSGDVVYMSDDLFSTCDLGCAFGSGLSGLGVTVGVDWYFN